MNFFKTGEDKPPLNENSAAIAKIFNQRRWSVFISITLGYAFYYVTRLNFSVVKKPLLDSGVIDAQQLGLMGSVFFITYAVGKFVNSFLCDRLNVKKFMSIGLFLSGLCTTFMGLSSTFSLLLILYGLNGWFQSFGAGPSIIALNQWFSDKERGTYYGIWFMSHNIGAAVTYMVTAVLVTRYSWQAGFLAPGVIVMVMSVLLYIFLHDRPETYGLPNIAEFKGEPVTEKVKDKSVSELQMMVIKSPAVWILGLASACCYITRYAIESWGIVYLTEAKGYSMIGASGLLSTMQMAGVIGTILGGFISDKIFNSRRNVPALIFGIVYAGSTAAFLWAPASDMIDLVSMICYGFSMGILVCFLGGLMAVDIAPRRATGAAMGMIGLFSYMGAALQENVTGYFINAHKTIVGGKAVYDFTAAGEFWVGAAVLSCLLALLVWNVKPKN